MEGTETVRAGGGDTSAGIPDELGRGVPGTGVAAAGVPAAGVASFGPDGRDGCDTATDPFTRLFGQWTASRYPGAILANS